MWLKDHAYIAEWLGVLFALGICFKNSQIKKDIFKLGLFEAFQYLMLFGSTAVVVFPGVNPVTRLAASIPAGFLFGFMTTYRK
jgi:hypothetical protein